MKKFILFTLLLKTFTSFSQELPTVDFGAFGEIEDADSKKCNDNKIFMPYPSYLNIDCVFGGFLMIFNDEFNGTELELDKWVAIEGVARDNDLATQRAWHLSENNIVNDGKLNITAKKYESNYFGTWVVDYSTNPWTYKTEDFKYSTGEIMSKYRYKYGVYEIKCKIPKGKGFWPAFWTYWGDSKTTWNEIDVFEFWNEYDLGAFDPFKSVRDINTNYIHIDNVDVQMNCSMDEFSTIDIDFSAAPHVFTMIYDPSYIAWLVDGIPIRFESKYTKEGVLFRHDISCEEIEDENNDWYYKDGAMPDQPMNIIANLAIQNGKRGLFDNDNNEPDENTIFPQAFEIEYIRHWKKFDCPTELHFPDKASLYLSDQGIYNVIMGTEVTIDNAIFTSNDQLHVIYTEGFEPGDVFEASDGITFEYLQNFDCNNQGIIQSDGSILNVEQIKNDFYKKQEVKRDSLPTVLFKEKADNYVLIDINGREVQKGKWEENISFSNFNKGLYIYIEFNKNQEIVNRKKLIF